MTPTDPPITPGQRAYLAAFEAWLRNPTAENTQRRQRFFTGLCRSAGIDPRKAPEQREGAPVDTEHSPRPTGVVLSTALSELRQREARLARLAGELAEVRTAIKAIEKLLPKTRPAPAVAPAAEAAPMSAASEDALVLKVISESQPIASGRLMARTGLSLHATKAALARLRSAGTVTMVGEKAGARYWLTADAPADPAVTEAMAA